MYIYHWYGCYYPHRSRELVSPVCGIFINKTENVILHAVMSAIADHLGAMISVNCKTFKPKEKTIKNTTTKTEIGRSLKIYWLILITKTFMRINTLMTLPINSLKNLFLEEKTLCQVNRSKSNLLINHGSLQNQENY